MNQATVAEFQSFLTSMKYSPVTAGNYTRAIKSLTDLPDTNEPKILFDYIEHALASDKEALSKSSPKNIQSPLNAFFLMKTGIQISEFRKNLIAGDQYTQILNEYTVYCRDFLQLKDMVVSASVREVRLFLEFSIPDIGQAEWDKVDANTIISFMKEKRSGLCVASAGVTLTSIRRFFRFLQHSNEKIHLSVLSLPLSVPDWGKGGRLPITLNADDRSALDSFVFPETPAGIRNKAILLCFTELGLRCSEVASLKLEDIKWMRGTIVIRKTKTREERELPMSAALGEALENYILHSRPEKFGKSLFYKQCRNSTEEASTETIRSVIRRIFKKAGIKGWHIGTHALRRSVGSDLYSSGNSLKTVADFLGHKSISTTKAYVRIDIKALAEVASAWPERSA